MKRRTKRLYGFISAAIVLIVLLRKVPTSQAEVLKASNVIRYPVGPYGERTKVRHTVKLWSETDYTTETDYTVFMNRLRDEAYNNWTRGNRNAGATYEPWQIGATEKAGLLWRWGYYYADADGMDFFWDVMRFLLEPHTTRAQMIAWHILTQVDLPTPIGTVAFDYTPIIENLKSAMKEQQASPSFGPTFNV